MDGGLGACFFLIKKRKNKPDIPPTHRWNEWTCTKCWLLFTSALCSAQTDFVVGCFFICCCVKRRIDVSLSFVRLIYCDRFKRNKVPTLTKSNHFLCNKFIRMKSIVLLEKKKEKNEWDDIRNWFAKNDNKLVCACVSVC